MKKSFSAKDISCIGAFTALLSVCSWISIPTTVPFTLQTFAVFLTVGLLGGRLGSVTVLVYILLAAVGAPVLSGFTGGVGVLLGSTGGYIFGFFLSALFLWGVERIWGNSLKVLAVGMAFGMVLYYLCGTLWYIWICTTIQGSVSVFSALLLCVFPFLFPDFIKIALALYLTARLRSYVK